MCECDNASVSVCDSERVREDAGDEATAVQREAGGVERLQAALPGVVEAAGCHTQP